MIEVIFMPKKGTVLCWSRDTGWTSETQEEVVLSIQWTEEQYYNEDTEKVEIRKISGSERVPLAFCDGLLLDGELISPDKIFKGGAE
tara:strand:+ start:357 stop:617 length:261 start_codon:yes stop_codon:yes gene_type:complete